VAGGVKFLDAVKVDICSRCRQIQMMQKLEVMRKKKQEYLEYQRQLAVHRMAQTERQLMHQPAPAILPGQPLPPAMVAQPPQPGQTTPKYCLAFNLVEVVT
jgi:hypothetical protein